MGFVAKFCMCLDICIFPVVWVRGREGGREGREGGRCIGKGERQQTMRRYRWVLWGDGGLPLGALG